MSAKAMPFSKFPIKLEDQTPLLLDLWFSLSARERTNRFVDSKTAAEFAAVSQRTIRFWIDLGYIDAIKIGKKYHVSIDSLNGYIASHALHDL